MADKRLIFLIIPGFFISAIIFYLLNVAFPVPIPEVDDVDEVDFYGTFTEAEARRLGIAPLETESISSRIEIERTSSYNVHISGEGKHV